jgi:hypothetical protein
MLKHCFLVYEKIQYDFLALRHLAVCIKTFFFLFSSFFKLMKTRYFNTGFVFLRCKIQTDIKQNRVENTRKNYNFSKAFLRIFSELGRTPPKHFGLDRVC